MEDLTIIMLTINNIESQKFVDFHKKTLLEAAGNYPIIIISKDPMDWGLPNVKHLQQEVPPFEEMWARTCNVYTQTLRGAKEAKTPYIAIVEDDCLYPKEHFKFRPSLDTFAYNHSRWCMFSWKREYPFYYLMPTDANCLMIAPREKVIQALDGREINRRTMHRLVEPRIAFNTYEPVLCFYHEQGNDSLERTQKKRPWPIRAFDIPKWGKAKHIIDLWK